MQNRIIKFRKKPVVVDAIQYLREENIMEVQDFFGDGNGREFVYLTDINEYAIRTLEGEMIVSKGDWIIRGVKGEYYPCKPDIFALTYEPITESNAEGGTPPQEHIRYMEKEIIKKRDEIVHEILRSLCERNEQLVGIYDNPSLLEPIRLPSTCPKCYTNHTALLSDFTEHLKYALDKFHEFMNERHVVMYDKSDFPETAPKSPENI